MTARTPYRTFVLSPLVRARDLWQSEIPRATHPCFRTANVLASTESPLRYNVTR